MNPLLKSLCAQLRHPGNAKGRLGEQAAAALESLWADNARFALELEVNVRRTLEESSSISEFGALR